jgi:hypothetical protein
MPDVQVLPRDAPVDGSDDTGLRDAPGGVRLVVAVNKADLLPSKASRKRLEVRLPIRERASYSAYQVGPSALYWFQ